MIKEPRKLRRLQQASITADGIDVWAAPGLYGLVKDVAAQYGFDAGMAHADITVRLEAVEEGADLDALGEALDSRGLIIGHLEVEERRR